MHSLNISFSNFIGFVVITTRGANVASQVTLYTISIYYITLYKLLYLLKRDRIQILLYVIIFERLTTETEKFSNLFLDEVDKFEKNHGKIGGGSMYH